MNIFQCWAQEIQILKNFCPGAGMPDDLFDQLGWVFSGVRFEKAIRETNFSNIIDRLQVSPESHARWRYRVK
ncbi:MAG: hypothetical protein LJE96_16750 [Deltaproteobacteria bacterium]|nr:hypothetical protein [Deltaproteobacteria bacterium]